MPKLISEGELRFPDVQTVRSPPLPLARTPVSLLVSKTTKFWLRLAAVLNKAATKQK
jgi:hypothetical protein